MELFVAPPPAVESPNPNSLVVPVVNDNLKHPGRHKQATGASLWHRRRTKKCKLPRDYLNGRLLRETEAPESVSNSIVLVL